MVYEVIIAVHVSAGSAALAADQAAEELAGMSLSEIVERGHVQPVAECQEVA